MMKRYLLPLRELDETRLREFEAIAERHGFGFGFLADCSPREIEGIYWLHQECRKRQPPVETRQVPQEKERWYETFASPAANPELYGVLCNGDESIAVSCLVRAEVPDEFLCGFTGILSSFSKQGLALALKSRLLRKAREHGLDAVVTQVRSDNLSMLRVNERLGFVADN